MIAINEFYKKVGDRASDIFLAEKDFFERFKGVLIGGPTPTKEEFEAGAYLHHELQKRIIGLFDVAYTNETGLAELVENAADALKDLDIIKEKNVMNRFLRNWSRMTVRPPMVRRASGRTWRSAVDPHPLKLRRARLRLACPTDDYTEERTNIIEPGNTSGTSTSAPVQTTGRRFTWLKRPISSTN